MRKATYAVQGGSYSGKNGSRPSGVKATSKTQCQKCLQFGHFTSDCTNPRLYHARPSRTQQFLNPNKRPKLMETKLADIDEPIRAAGTADRILAAKEKAREKGIKQRSNSVSSSDSSVSSVSSVSSSSSESESDSGSSRSRPHAQNEVKSKRRSRSESFSGNENDSGSDGKGKRKRSYSRSVSPPRRRHEND